MKTKFYEMALSIAITIGMVWLSGCGDQNPVTQESSSPISTLIVSRNDDGSLGIVSEDGRSHNLDILEKFLDGKLPGVKIKLLQSLSEKVQAAPTRYPASDYMTDVSPRSDAVWVSLTWLGFQVGLNSAGAGALATFTITEYERISGKGWPYHKRSHQSLANEIQFHCLLLFTPLWRRAFPVNAGFDENYWD